MSVKAPGSYVCHKLGSAIFFVTLACLDISSRKGIYRDFLHIILKAHTISNKLVSKVFAQKKGKISYDSYKYVFKFWWFQVPSPPILCILHAEFCYRVSVLNQHTFNNEKLHNLLK